MKVSDLKKIITKIEYQCNTAHGKQSFVSSQRLLAEIKKFHIESIKANNRHQEQLEKEQDVLECLSFKQSKELLMYYFHIGDITLFIDYRSGKRKSWAIDENNNKVDKNTLEIYQVFKLKSGLTQTKDNIKVRCDNCGSVDCEIYGSQLHEIRKYKCNTCKRVFKVE